MGAGAGAGSARRGLGAGVVDLAGFRGVAVLARGVDAGALAVPADEGVWADAAVEEPPAAVVEDAVDSVGVGRGVIDAVEPT